MAAQGWWEKSRVHQSLSAVLRFFVPSSLRATNAPVDGYVPSKATGEDLFTWIAPGGGGGTVPTGTGFTHITAGVQDAAAKSVDLATADVTGDLPYANLVPATAASRILVRGSAGGAGDWQEGTLGTGLALTGTVLSATGGITETDTGITIVGGGLLGAVIDTSLISAQIRGMCTGTYDYSGSDDYQLWVSPTPSSGVFTLDVWKRSFGNTAPAPGDSVCAGAYPTLTGTGTDFTAVGATSTWTGSLVRGDMLTVAPTVNTAGVKWWALYIPARRTF
jgi:hypothetical protein